MIILARHGSTSLNEDPERFRAWSNPPLDAKGKMQAAKLARKIGKLDIHWDDVYCSNLQRTETTARTIQSIVKAPMFKETECLRPWHLGTFEGKIVKDYLPELRTKYIDHPDVKVPGGECLNDFVNRAINFLKHELEEDCNTIIVAHSRHARLYKAWFAKGMQGYDYDRSIFESSDDPVEPGDYMILKKD